MRVYHYTAVTEYMHMYLNRIAWILSESVLLTLDGNKLLLDLTYT